MTGLLWAAVAGLLAFTIGACFMNSVAKERYWIPGALLLTTGTGGCALGAYAWWATFG